MLKKMQDARTHMPGRLTSAIFSRRPCCPEDTRMPWPRRQRFRFRIARMERVGFFGNGLAWRIFRPPHCGHRFIRHTALP